MEMKWYDHDKMIKYQHDRLVHTVGQYLDSILTRSAVEKLSGVDLILSL